MFLFSLLKKAFIQRNQLCLNIVLNAEVSRWVRGTKFHPILVVQNDCHFSLKKPINFPWFAQYKIIAETKQKKEKENVHFPLWIIIVPSGTHYPLTHTHNLILWYLDPLWYKLLSSKANKEIYEYFEWVEYG